MAKTKVWSLSGVTLLILIFCILLSLFIQYPPNYAAQEQYWSGEARKVQDHIQSWSEQKIVKYKIGVHLSYVTTCDKELIVDNNAVIQVIKDNCAGDDFVSGFNTIEDFFSLIKSQVNAKRCGPNGCDCDGPSLMEVTYDKEYKFPKTARPTLHPEERWMFETTSIIQLPDNFLTGLTGRKFCTLLGDLGIGWEVYSFLPLK